MCESRPQLVVSYALTNNDLKWGDANLTIDDDFFASCATRSMFYTKKGERSPR